MYKPINKKTVEKLVESGTIKIIPIDELRNEHYLSLNNEKMMMKLFSFRLNGFKNNYMCVNLVASDYVNTQERFELYLSALLHILKTMVLSNNCNGKGFLSIKSKDSRVLEALYEAGLKRIKAGRSLSKGDDEVIYSGMGFFGNEVDI
jgi:hypothetical protein